MSMIPSKIAWIWLPAGPWKTVYKSSKLDNQVPLDFMDTKYVIRYSNSKYDFNSQSNNTQKEENKTLSFNGFRNDLRGKSHISWPEKPNIWYVK